MFAALGRFSVRFRWLVVVAWIALAVLFNSIFPALSSQIRQDTNSFLPKNTPVVKASNLAKPFQPPDAPTTNLAVGNSSSKLDAKDMQAIASLEAGFRKIDGVTRVEDFGTSPDGKALLGTITFSTNVPAFTGQGKAKQIVDEMRSQIAKAHFSSGTQAHLTGDLAMGVDEAASSQHQSSDTDKLTMLFIIVLLLLVFRALLAPVLTLLPAGVALLVAQPLIGEFAKHGLPTSFIMEILLVVLMLGAGTDYGLFLTFRVREELRAGREPKDAVAHALSRVGESITFSAATVIVALLGLLFASFGLYSGLGPGLAIGIAVVLLAGLTLLPALLAIFGRAVFWPTRTRSGDGKAGLWGRAASSIVRRPVVTLVIGVIVFGGLACGLFGFSSGGFGSPSSSSSGSSDSAKGTQIIDAHYPKGQSNPTNIVFHLARPLTDDPAQAIVATQALQSHTDVFNAVTGPADPAGVMLTSDQIVQALAGHGKFAKAIGQFVSKDRQSIIMFANLRAGDPNGDKAAQATPAMRKATADAAKQIDAKGAGVVGIAPAAYDISQISNHDIERVTPIVLAIILVLLALLLRSLVAPWYLIVSVGISYLAALGLATIVFVGFAGDDGINFVLPFFMFIFLMALGEDYNILVMSRIREEAHSYPLAEAVRRAVAATGTTVTSAGLILAGTFGVLVISGHGQSQIEQIGLGLGAGILMDTFLVRTLLVPSTVVLLGKWNWWPSHLSTDEHLEKVGNTDDEPKAPALV